MTQTLSPDTTPVAPRVTRSAFALALADCGVLIGRNVRHITRNPEQLFQAVSLPIILTLLFRYFFGGAINTGTMTYANYMIAGLMVISIAFNSTSTVVGVADDMRNGIVERFRSMPMLGPAVLVGHVVSAVLRNALSVVVMIAVGLLVGFRPEAGVGGWLAALGVLLLMATAVSWLAVILGLAAKTVEGAGGLGMILVFLPYASSALVPTESMPGVLRAIVENQPFTAVADTLRALFADTPVGSAGWLALVWWVGILVLTVPFAVRLFHRRATR